MQRSFSRGMCFMRQGGYRNLLKAAPQDVVEQMRAEGISRVALVLDKPSNTLRASHPMFDEVAEVLSADKRDFHSHEAVFFGIGATSNTLLSAAVHTTVRGQSAGGVRLWRYDTLGDYLVDGMRLSLGMGRKNALAGLWWGGGKGVIARPPVISGVDKAADPVFRKILFKEYGSFVTSLQGCYVTAEDVGVNVTDMRQIFSNTRYATCIPPDVGGSGNPSVATGWGVVCGMEGALDHLGMGTLEGKTVAVQGLGNVARPCIARLVERGVSKIIGTDISQSAVDAASDEFRSLLGSHKVKWDLRVVERGDNSVLTEDADVVAPCALGGVLNADTIPNIKAKVVCGAANNQLLNDPEDADMLKEHGITYVPDFLANRMGIVNCANEQYGHVNDDPAIERHFGRDWDNSIFKKTHQVLDKAEKDGVNTAVAGNTVADQMAAEPHPIWGHRQAQVIASLQANRWAEGREFSQTTH